MFLKTKIAALALFLMAGTLFITAEESVELNDPYEIIKKMDKVMYPDSKSEIYIKTVVKNRVTDENKMISYSKDINQKILIRFTEPASLIGDDIILLEKNVWQIDSESNRIIKVPSNLTFGGTGFSYGDVIRLNFSDNYSPGIIEEDNSKWVINLVAKEKSTPYYRVEMEISKSGYIPVKAACFGKNGQIIKNMIYSDVKDFNGVKKPATVTVTSPHLPDEVSVLTILWENLKAYPDVIFNKNNLEMRLEEN